MTQTTQKVNAKKLAYLFMFTYMVSYITRTNYGAIIAEMVADTGMAKSVLSLALTGSFITYGAGQIVSGICGDHFRPKKLVTYGLILTTLMNLLIPLCQNPYQMIAVWSVNGFAQAFMWPPIVTMMATLLTSDEYDRALVIVSRGSAAGTIFVYLSSPLLISLAGWKSVFLFSAVFSAAMIIFWNRLCLNVDTRPAKSEKPAERKTASLFTPLMFGIMFTIILQGILRDGVTTWMPSYISETYHLGSEISILTGAILPIFSIVCFQITSGLYRKHFPNPLFCSAIIFAAGALGALALYLFSGQNAAFSVLFSALITGSMHGVNLLLVCTIPRFFLSTGNVSTVSGVLNSCTYIGSALSTYGIAVLAENQGWHFTILIWFLIAVFGTVFCLFGAKPWAKKHPKD